MTELKETQDSHQRRLSLEDAIAEWMEGHVSDKRDRELERIIRAGVHHVVNGGDPATVPDDDTPF